MTRATATSTRSCSPPTASRCATRSSATGAGWTPAPRPTCTSTRPSSTPRSAAAAAEFLGVDAAELAFTDSTTMGLGLVYSGLLGPGDEVLTTEHDHYATHESLRLSGANVRRVALYDDPAQATPGEMLARLRRRDHAAHDGRRGDLGALRHRRQAAAARARRRRAAGRRRRRPRARRHRAARRRRRADRRHAQVARRPARHRPDLDARVGPQIRADDPELCTSATTPARASRPAAGTPSSTAGRSRRPSRPTTATRQLASRQLATRLKDGLSELPNVRLITPRDPAVSAGIVCFEVSGMDAPTAVHASWRRGSAPP